MKSKIEKMDTLRKARCVMRQDFSDQLSDLIFERKIKHKMVAAQLHVAVSLISHWVAGRRVPTLSQLSHLVRVLELTDEQKYDLVIKWNLAFHADEVFVCLVGLDNIEPSIIYGILNDINISMGNSFKAHMEELGVWKPISSIEN